MAEYRTKYLLTKHQKKKKVRKLRFKIYAFLFVLFVVAFGVVYGTLNVNFLKIKRVETIGLVDYFEVRAEVLRGKLSQFYGFGNLLAWPGEFQEIEIKKDYFKGTLTLIGTEPEHYAIWCSRKCIWVNRQGIASDPAPNTEGSSIITVQDSRSLMLTSGKSVLDKELFTNVVNVIDGLSPLPIRIMEFKYNDRLQELTAFSVGGGKLVFSLRFNPSAKLFASISDLVDSGDWQKANYVDLTVENRLYIK